MRPLPETLTLVFPLDIEKAEALRKAGEPISLGRRDLNHLTQTQFWSLGIDKQLVAGAYVVAATEGGGYTRDIYLDVDGNLIVTYRVKDNG